MHTEKVQIINVPLEHRVESGPVQFNDDWPGTFIRGDNSLWYAMVINNVLKDISNTTLTESNALDIIALRSLADLLSSCAVKHLTDK